MGGRGVWELEGTCGLYKVVWEVETSRLVEERKAEEGRESTHFGYDNSDEFLFS